jgi:uncharacterized low-complexity protein
MRSRILLAASLLLLAAVASVPAASADDAVDATVLGHHVTACVIAVYGSCDPYNGDLARVTVDGTTVRVPDPCYTTSCF